MHCVLPTYFFQQPKHLQSSIGFGEGLAVEEVIASRPQSRSISAAQSQPVSPPPEPAADNRPTVTFASSSEGSAQVSPDASLRERRDAPQLAVETAPEPSHPLFQAAAVVESVGKVRVHSLVLFSFHSQFLLLDRPRILLLVC